MNRTPSSLLAILVLAACTASPCFGRQEAQRAPTKLHVLLVVAHPDDEYEMAATVYHIAKELSGSVDQLIITDGEAGYRYSSLAEQFYGVKLADEADGRRQLPRIRREEAHRAARILGIEHQWFLNEKDERFTLDAPEVLEQCWHQDRIVKAIAQRLRLGRYTQVLVLLPTSETHGAHQAASILTLKAVEQLPPNEHPVVLGANASADDKGTYAPLSQYPLTATATATALFHFDRDAHFGYRNSLTYQIVVDWVIAEHKSQGLFQNRCRQDRFENFWVFRLGRELRSGDARIFPTAHEPAGTEQPGQALKTGNER